MASSASMRASGARLFSYFVFDFIVCMMLTTYLRQFGQNRVRLLRPQVGLLFLAVGSIVGLGTTGYRLALEFAAGYNPPPAATAS